MTINDQLPPLQPLQGLRLLLVEESALIALDLQEALMAAGAHTIGLANTDVAALKLIETTAFDAAVIDVSGVPPDLQVAETLIQANIPFVFATGALLTARPRSMQSVPLVAKPYSTLELIAALSLVSRRQELRLQPPFCD